MRWSGVASIAVLAVAAVAAAQDKAPTLTDEDRADLAWFEGLGYPKLGSLPFVEVRPGWDAKLRGFLASDDGTRFRVIGLDLSDSEYLRTPSGTPEGRRVAYEGLDVEEVAERWLAGGVAPGGAPPEHPWNDRATAVTEAFVFTCALAQAPEKASWFGPGIVHDLLAHTRTMRLDRWHRDDPPKPMRERVEADLARVAHDHAVVEVQRGEDSAAARRASLDEHRAVARRFPGTPEGAKSKALATVLERLVREDEERAKAGKAPDQAGYARIVELVRRLRDQEANGFSIPGGMGQIIDGPYRDLVALGPAAVPALLGALDDEGPSRCVIYGHAGYPAWPVSIGSLAFDALSEIAARQFTPPADVKIEPYDPAKYRVASRPTIEAWWAEVRKIGEAASLAKVVEEGGYQSLAAAERLAAKDAAVFADAIAKGVRASKELDARSRLIAIAAKHPSDAVTALLLDEMRTSPLLHPRIAAATALLPLRRDDAIAAMRAEWTLRREGKAPKPADDGAGSPIDEMSPLVGFFLTAQDPAAIRALGEGLLARPLDVRVETWGCLAHALGLDWRWTHAGWWSDSKLTEPAAIAAAEEVVALALGDVTVIDEEVLGPENQRGFDVRLADVAAAALGVRRGGGPTVTMSVEQRARATALVTNAWRKEHGLDAVEVSAAPEVAPVADDVIRPLLEAIAAAPWNSGDAKKHLDAVEALGPGAIAPLAAFLEVERKGPWVSALSALPARLAFHVRRVVVDAPGESLPAEFRTRADAWRGRAISGGELAAFAADLVRASPPRLARFTLVADRPGDGTGVLVTLKCVEGAPRRAGYWTRVVSALRGTEDVGQHNSYGSVIAPTAADFLTDGADRPFTAAPRERAYVRIDVR